MRDGFQRLFAVLRRSSKFLLKCLQVLERQNDENIQTGIYVPCRVKHLNQPFLNKLRVLQEECTIFLDLSNSKKSANFALAIKNAVEKNNRKKNVNVINN